MALSDQDKENLDSWFSPATREAENAWIERLTQIAPLYQEHGFTKGEGATLFMLASILFQINKMLPILQRWDEERE